MNRSPRRIYTAHLSRHARPVILSQELELYSQPIFVKGLSPMLRFCLLAVCLAFLPFGELEAANKDSVKPPNFVVIFIDDLGYADIGPFGATKQKTPHLDQMAKEGMKLTSFYAAPVCSVSRAAPDQLLWGTHFGAGRLWTRQPEWTQSLRTHDRRTAQKTRLSDRLHREMAFGRSAGVSSYPARL